MSSWTLKLAIVTEFVNISHFTKINSINVYMTQLPYLFSTESIKHNETFYGGSTIYNIMIRTKLIIHTQLTSLFLNQFNVENIYIPKIKNL